MTQRDHRTAAGGRGTLGMGAELTVERVCDPQKSGWEAAGPRVTFAYGADAEPGVSGRRTHAGSASRFALGNPHFKSSVLSPTTPTGWPDRRKEG